MNQLISITSLIRPRHLAVLACLVTLVVSSSRVSAAGYFFTDVHYPDPDTLQTFAYGINASGSVVGHYEVLDLTSNTYLVYGFLREPNALFYRISIDPIPSDMFTQARGINDAGNIVGFTAHNGADGFVRDPTNHFTVVNITPGGTVINGINAAGTLVGGYYESTGDFRGFIKAGANVTSFDLEQGASAYPKFTQAFGINAAGQVSGSFFDQAISGSRNAKLHGFVRDTNGAFTTIDVPNATRTAVYGINGAGDIVGWFDDGATIHGFVRNAAGTYTQIDVPGALFTQVHGITDDGRIVGIYSADVDHLARGFIGTPVGVVAQQLEALIAPLDLPAPIRKRLDAFLRQAAAILAAREDVDSTCRVLAGFTREVRAQAGKRLRDTQTKDLLAAVSQIKTTLRCP